MLKATIATALVFLAFSAVHPVRAQGNTYEVAPSQVPDSAAVEDPDSVAVGSDATDDGPTASLNILPVPIVDPTIGTGLAVAGLYTFPSPGADAGGPRSTLVLAAAYADSKSYLFGGGGNVHLGNDAIRLTGSAAYANANVDYFGRGGDSPLAQDPVPLNVRGFLANLGARFRVADRLYAGVLVKLVDGTLESEQQVEELPDTVVTYSQLALGPVVEFDTRDNSWWPTRGSVLSAQYLLYTELEPFFEDDSNIGGSFTKFEAKASTYYSMRENLVVAGQLRTAATSDEAPFFFLPSISLRGFPGGRYLDSFVIQGQAEIRWQAMRRFGMVAFTGVGVIGPSISELDEGATAVGYGLGIRYVLSKADHINIGVDVAFGGDGAALYFRVGEAF